MIPVKAKILKNQINAVINNNDDFPKLSAKNKETLERTKQKRKKLKSIRNAVSKHTEENEALVSTWQANLRAIPIYPTVGGFSMGVSFITFIIGAIYGAEASTVLISTPLASIISSSALTLLLLKIGGKPMPGAEDMGYILTANTLHAIIVPAIFIMSAGEQARALYFNACTALATHYGFIINPETFAGWVAGVDLILLIPLWIITQPDFRYLVRQPIEHML